MVWRKLKKTGRRLVRRGRRVAKRAVRNTGRRVIQSVMQQAPLLSRTLNPDPFPQKWNTKMTFSQRFAVPVPLTGSASEIDVRLNSVFDPIFLGTGKQPLYYDQISFLYRKYIVKSCHTRLVFTNPQADGIYVVVAAGFDNFGALTVGDLAERPYTKIMYFNNSGEQKNLFEENLKPHKVLGLTERQYMGDIDLTGAATFADPTKVAFLRIGAGNVDPLSVASQIECVIHLTYDVQFYDRDLPAPS